MIQFKDKALEAAVGTRANGRMNSNATARRDLERYYLLLSEAAPELSKAEASMICDACNGWPSSDSPRTPDYLWAKVDEVMRLFCLDDKWQVDGCRLTERLATMPKFQEYSIVDSVERFWARVAATGDAKVEDYFKLNG